MSYPPTFQEVNDTLRFGRALLVELVPPPPPGVAGRYDAVLVDSDRLASRSRPSGPDRAVREILGRVDRGASVDALVLGGPGEPLHYRGIGTVLRRVRSRSHLETVVLTNGRLLRDRETRREVGEAGLVVVWIPALEDPDEKPGGLERRDAWERHVEGVAALRRETPARIALELPVWPGRNDGPATLDAWSRCMERVRPDRVFIIPAPGALATSDWEPDAPETLRFAAALDRVREAVHPAAGAFLSDGSPVDQRRFDPA